MDSPKIGDAPAARVNIIDDDTGMRNALVDILRSCDIEAASFENGAAFLKKVPPPGAGCLVLDVRMPDVDGLEFQARLASLGYLLPVVMITGYGDIPMTVQAMKAGAVDFLTKPFDDEQFIRAATSALERDAQRRTREADRDLVIARASRLTPRERQVMAAVVRGLMNKQIAYELSLTEITVKLHRASLMKKMGVRTVPDLVRRAELLQPKSQELNSTPPYSGS